MRAFVALEISGSIRKALATAQQRLARAAPKVKWIDTDLIHLTVKFLGDINETDLGGITEAVGRCAAAANPTLLRFRGVGAFPRPDKPRIVWAGATEDPPVLAALHRALDQALAPFGAKRENRPFRAHATIGRVRRPRPMPELGRALDRMASEAFGEMEAAEIVLMQSELTPEGPVYTPLSRHGLGGPARTELQKDG